MDHDISSTDYLIDSRDVIALIKQIEAQNDPEDDDYLLELQNLAEQGKDASPDWEYGSTLINQSYFTEYCQELCEDIGDIPKELPHYIVVDWDATAKNLRVDYTEVEWKGKTFLIR